MISRRPKIMRSNENHPGPSRLMAIAIAARNTKGTRASRNSLCGVWDHVAAAPSTIVAPPIGVSSPAKTDRPPSAKIRPISVSASDAARFARCNHPWSAAAAPTTIRNRSRPSPGNPCGNVEKSCCRWAGRRLVRRFRTTPLRLRVVTPQRIPLSSYALGARGRLTGRWYADVSLTR
jgi:hypothetical protein